MNDQAKQRKHERETEAYKRFLVIARRIKKIEYSNNWQIVPDPSDPLRKFILEKETAWFKLQIVLYAKEFYHRGDYTDGRYDYKFLIGFKGFFNDKTGDIGLRSKLEVKPRMVKKLLNCINDRLLPNIYNEIKMCNDNYDQLHNKEKYFQTCLKRLAINLPNLKSTDNLDIGGNLALPLSIRFDGVNVEIQGNYTFEKFLLLAQKWGWVK